jgi:hypothetical protein
MHASEVEENLGKEVIVNSGRDLGMCSERRRLIGKTCTLFKRCKSGLLQVSYQGKLYSLAQYNVDAILEG